MRTGRIILVGGLVFFFLAITIGGCGFYSSYSTSIRLDETVKTAWADVETDLQRRYDLIPNLVESVKGVAGHEKEIIEQVTNARKSYVGAATPAARAEAATGIESALSRLLLIQEKYPDLKANQGFRDLMVSLEGTENRVAEKRRRYNEAVRELNTHVRGVFGSITSKWAGVTQAERFEAPEAAKEAPKVNFSTPG